MIYKKYLLRPVTGKKINKQGKVKVYTPKRKSYKNIKSEEEGRFFLTIYPYKEAIILIDKLQYGSEE